jgi:Tfp pilus assembly protein PilE
MSKNKISKINPSKGDTIVEVLIAIAIAAFAIGTSYAIANRSLLQAITARERNQAVNIIQSQISALKIRYVANTSEFYSEDPTDPTKGFTIPSTTPTPPSSALPYTAFHFCLDEQSASADDTAHPWVRQTSSMTDAEADNIGTGNKYNPACIKDVSGTQYFVDISAQITNTSKDTTSNRTVYKLTVRWPQVGNTTTAQSTIYYRL